MEKNKEALKGKWDLVVTNPAFVRLFIMPSHLVLITNFTGIRRTSIVQTAIYEYASNVLSPFTFHQPLLPTIPSSSPEKSLSLSPLQMYNAVILGNYHVGDPLAPAGSWIDVRDLAKMHVLALGFSEEASGQRIIMNVGVYIWQEFCASASLLRTTLGKLLILIRPKWTSYTRSHPLPLVSPRNGLASCLKASQEEGRIPYTRLSAITRGC